MTDAVRLITHTREPARQPWPADVYVQGGKAGLVVRRDGDAYTTAFVEVAHGGMFIRGEGDTIAAAEANAWAQYDAQRACGEHDWETRGYTNGAGFCRRCKVFNAHVFTGAQLGQFCTGCSAGTTWGRYSPDAYWDNDTKRIVNAGPPERFEWRCEECAPCRAEVATYLDELNSVSVSRESLEKLFTSLDARQRENDKTTETASGDVPHDA
jgi:hypothetical protein